MPRSYAVPLDKGPSHHTHRTPRCWSAVSPSKAGGSYASTAVNRTPRPANAVSCPAPRPGRAHTGGRAGQTRPAPPATPRLPLNAEPPKRTAATPQGEASTSSRNPELRCRPTAPATTRRHSAGARAQRRSGRYRSAALRARSAGAPPRRRARPSRSGWPRIHRPSVRRERCAPTASSEPAVGRSAESAFRARVGMPRR